MNEPIRQSAIHIVEQLRNGAITPLDCLDALEARIAAVNAPVNALVTLCFDRARDHAKHLMAKPMAERGVLCGLPLPIKDLSNVQGVRSTQGSRIFKSRIAEQSSVVVRHLESAGGIVYAMSNTPEFGAGAQTFNDVFGISRNPWNTKLTPAGSSGGAAVALATGMAWVAQGSDLGGSLRNPASFCGVVGMRPSPGLVATDAVTTINNTLSVDGPMARNVADTALLLDAMVGQEPCDPLSQPRPKTSYLSAAQNALKPRRVAVSRNLGITPVDKEVAAIILNAAQKLEADGVIVEETHPDMSEALECFQTLRAFSFASSMRQLLADHRDLLKPEVIWNIEKGLALTVDKIAHAENQRATLYHRMSKFFETYDVLLCPATITAPFPVEERFLKSCDGVAFETYVDWLAIVSVATLCACPAISIPCGFTKNLLPVGLQVITRNRSDAQLLAYAAYMETVLGQQNIVPIDPRVTH